MNPTVGSGTVAWAGEPALITHEELVIHRARIHFTREPEEFPGFGRRASNRVDTIAHNDWVGCGLPHRDGRDVRGRLHYRRQAIRLPIKQDIRSRARDV